MKRLSYLMLLAATLLMWVSCAEEAITPNKSKNNEQEPDTKGLTEFVVADNATRTTAEYFDKGGTNRGLHFYWTAYDQLWVNNGGTLIQNASNTINDVLTENTTTPGGVKRATKASFVFAGTFTAPSYPVRYTGVGWGGKSNKVTIKAQQVQTVPNDASRIAEFGDCGTATATKVGNRYHFTLDHKAAYITFLPFSTQAIVRTGTIEKIRVTADQAVCGEFNFNDAGIDLTSRPAPTIANRSIEFRLVPSGSSGFPIPSTPTISANAAIMVIAPGSYTNFTVEYIFRGNGTISKRYPGTVTFTAGMNKRISQDLQVNVYPLSYSEWNGVVTKSCPNANEIAWYVGEGNPLWDNRLWANAPSAGASWGTQLISGGIWLKKLSRIAADHGKNVSDLKLAAPNGVNCITTNPGNAYYKTLPYGKPADNERNDYFFLPAVGYRAKNSNIYEVGSDTYYWSSTMNPAWANTAYCLFFEPGDIQLNTKYTYHFEHWRTLWTADTNAYQPIGY